MDCGFAEDSPQPPTATAPLKEGSWKPSKSQMDELGLVWLEVGAHGHAEHIAALVPVRVLPVPTGCFEPPETPLSLSVAYINRLTYCITMNQTGSIITTQDSPSHRRYSTEIVTTAEAIGPSWLREIWICGINPAPRAERCAERAFRRSCITA